MLSSITNFVRRHDIDYADVMMMTLAFMFMLPALTLAGYGIYASIGFLIGS